MLQNSVSVEQAARTVAEEETLKLKGLVLESDELTAKLVESNKALEATCTEVVFLKEEVKRVDTKKVELERVVAKVCEGSEQCKVLLNNELAGWNRAEKLTRSLVTK